MICALLLGRGGPGGFPGKNTHLVLGRSLMSYPLVAAQESDCVDKVFVSSDSEEIIKIGNDYGAETIKRPNELCTNEALAEDAYLHGYEYIKRRLVDENIEVEIMILLFANSPTLTSEHIDEAVRVLREDETLDSAVTVSRYNMWSPLRARKIGPDGCLEPFVPFETLGDLNKLNCDRDSQGDVYFADMSLCAVRPRCLENIDSGLLPQKWLGKKIYPIHNWGGLDVDYDWQLPQVEFWLKAHGLEPTIK